MKLLKHLPLLFVTISTISHNTSIADEFKADELKEGVWVGSFITTHDKRYKVKYHVFYENIENTKNLQIEMMNLDLDPMPEYTFQLTNIKLQPDAISFKIPDEYDIKTCVLKRMDDGGYEGECLSNQDINDAKSHITMLPYQNKREQTSKH